MKLQNEEEEISVKSIILINYLSKVKDLLSQRKKKKNVNHTQEKLLLEEQN